MKKIWGKLLVVFLVIILLIVTNICTILVLKGKSKEQLSSNWKSEKLAATNASGWGTINSVVFAEDVNMKTVNVEIERVASSTTSASPTILYKWDSRATGVGVGEFSPANEKSGTYKGTTSGIDRFVYEVPLNVESFGTFHLHVLVGGTVYSSNCTVEYECLSHEYNSYTDNGNLTHSAKCIKCGYKYTASHTWNDATCTKPKTCNFCNATYGEALGHAGATHANGGKCTRCNVVYEKHEKNIDSYITTNFEKYHRYDYRCSLYPICDEYFESEEEEHFGGTHENGGECEECRMPYQEHGKSTTIAKYSTTQTGHTPVYKCKYSGCTTTYTGTSVAHTEVIDKAVVATCEAAGKTEGKHCSVCDKVIVAQQTIAAKGHTEIVDKAVAATCEIAGKTEGKHCSVCDKVIVAQQTIAAKGHTEVIDSAVAATCEAAGKTEGKHCSVCDKVIVAQTTIPALGHKEVTIPGVEATCEENGKTEGKKCTVCDKVMVAQTTIPALGHKEVIMPGVEATCEAAGKTEGKHCSVCNKVIVAQQTIAAKGHTEVIVSAIEATCETAGKTEGKHCSVCNKVLVKQEIIPAKGHNYEKGECTNCGEKSEEKTIIIEKCEIKENMITRVLPETKLKDLKIQTNATKIEVYNTKNELVDENEKVATGMKLKLELNGQEKEYIFVVIGDLTGDGKIGNADLLRMVRYKAGLDNTLKGCYLEAADIIKDNKPGQNSDILKLARVLVGLEKF